MIALISAVFSTSVKTGFEQIGLASNRVFCDSSIGDFSQKRILVDGEKWEVLHEQSERQESN